MVPVADAMWDCGALCRCEFMVLDVSRDISHETRELQRGAVHASHVSLEKDGAVRQHVWCRCSSRGSANPPEVNAVVGAHPITAGAVPHFSPFFCCLFP